MQRGMARWEVSMPRLIHLPDKWELFCAIYWNGIFSDLRQRLQSKSLYRGY